MVVGEGGGCTVAYTSIYHRIEAELHNSDLCIFDMIVDNIERLPVPVLHYL